MSDFTSSVPRPTYGANGLQIPQETDILSGVASDFKNAYGPDLDFTNLETPHGQIASSSTAIIADKNDQILWFVSQVDPATNEGRMQDGIARIYFLERDPAIATSVLCTLTGASGTKIPAGTRAVDVNNIVYFLTSDIEIPAAETITATFQCSVTGPVECPANTLNRPYSTITGWDTITNLQDGVTGSLQETPQAFEQRRFASVALNSRGGNAAVRSAVLSLNSVLDAYVTDNKTNASVTVGGVTLLPHSLYVCAQGGSDEEIAQVILDQSAFGCDYNGNTTVTLFDESYAPPYPTYQVTFQRPDPVSIQVLVMLRNNNNVPSNMQALVRAAVLATFTGVDGSLRPRIGGGVYASSFYAGVAMLGAWAQIIRIEVGTTNANGDSVALDIDQIPTLIDSSITVVAN